MVENLSKKIATRQQITLTFFLLSLAVLLITFFYGRKGVEAVAFLIGKQEITLQEIFRILRFWFWALVVGMLNYPVIFAVWYFSDRKLQRMIQESEFRGQAPQ